MKIGIGITSFNRPEHLELCLRQIYKHVPEIYDNTEFDFMDYLKTNNEYRTDSVILFIAKDIPNIAKAKNECLYALKDCDHIFLFDDDCFPIKDGWIDFFTSTGHALYLNERHNNISPNTYTDTGGCFMYISKNEFNQVGYFNSDYKQYGFEHAGYSKRINKVNGDRHYTCWEETNKYLYSLDYQGEGDWGIKHKPSITDYKAMQESIDYNRKVFEREISGDKIYYDYKP